MGGRVEDEAGGLALRSAAREWYEEKRHEGQPAKKSLTWQLLHNRVSLGHAHYSQRKSDSDDNGKALGNGSHRSVGGKNGKKFDVLCKGWMKTRHSAGPPLPFCTPRATYKLTEMVNMRTSGRPCRRPTTRMTPMMPKESRDSFLPSSSMLTCSGVFRVSTSCRRIGRWRERVRQAVVAEEPGRHALLCVQRVRKRLRCRRPLLDVVPFLSLLYTPPPPLSLDSHVRPPCGR